MIDMRALAHSYAAWLPGTTGFWGTPTSTVDWCEQNYQHTYWVAELFNSLSSVTMVLQGLIGLFLHRKLESRIRLCYLSIAVVGLGSLAFHTSLRFELQMLDELPMLYGCLVFLYCVVMENSRCPIYSLVLSFVLATVGALLTLLVSTNRGQISMVIFRSAYGLMALALFTFGAQRYHHAGLRPRRAGAPYQNVFLYASACYVVATLLWTIDNTMCEQLHAIGYPHLHAVWHILASTGCVSFAALLAYERQRVLMIHDLQEKDPRFADDADAAGRRICKDLSLRFFFGIPYVSIRRNVSNTRKKNE